MNALRKLMGETAIYGMSHILPRIFHFLVMTVYLTHRFNEDTADFGIYNKLYAYATIILSIMVFRMDTAYFRYASREDDKEKVFFNSSLILGVGTVIVVGMMLVFRQYIATWLNYPDQSYYVSWFAWILGFDAITSVVFARFRLASRPLRFLFFRVANVLFTVFFVMFFLEIVPRFFPGIQQEWMELLGLKRELDFVFLANLLASGLLVLMMIPEFLKVNTKVDGVLMKNMWKYSWPLVIVALAGNVNQVIGIIVQEYWLSGTLEENMAQVGIFSAGAKLAILLNLFTSAFNYASEPFFFNNATKEKSVAIFGEVALAYTIFASMVALGTYLYIDAIVVLIGSSYHDGVQVVPLLLMSYVLLGLYYMVSVWYKLSDHTLVGAMVSCVGVVITCGVSYILLPTLGIMGSAWASFLCFGGMVLLCVWLGQKYYPISYPWKRILVLITMTGLALYISFYIRNYMDVTVQVRLLLNTLVLSAVILSMYVLEKDFIRNLTKLRPSK